MNKSKLNQPDVEQGTTKPHIETIKNPIIRDGYRQYENYCPHCKCHITILGNYCPNCGKPIDWGHNNVETTTLPYKQVLIQPDPTIEEVKQEWEDDDYHFTNKEDYVLISNKEKYFFIVKISKKCSIQNWQEENSVVSITPKEAIRLTKTFRTLGWSDEVCHQK
jgi:hypothetical protein